MWYASRSSQSTPALARLNALRTMIERIGEAMGDAAGWAYLLCALLITFDVVSRKFFGFSSQGTTEISGYMLGFGITWGLAHALATKAHIRVDVLVMRLPLWLRAYLHALAFILLTFVSVFLPGEAGPSSSSPGNSGRKIPAPCPFR